MKSLGLAALAALSLNAVMAACGGAANDDLGGGGPAGDGGGATADAGGGSDGGVITIAASEFKQECSADDECVAVTSGNVCALCSCQNDAIAKSELEAFNARLQKLKAECPMRPGIGCQANCMAPKVSCSSEGKCVFSADGTSALDAGDGG